MKTAIDKKTPPRGLIPKISPKLPDTPGNFIIKWEGIQKETGLHLTETLKEYWIDRAKKLTEELEPIKNKVRLETSPAQWNKIQGIIENISRNITRPQEKEEHSEIRTKQINTTANETKHQRRFQRTITHIINISKYKLTPGETSLLSKGLNFIPTPKKEHPVKLLQDILLFDRRLRLKYFFHHNNYTQPTKQNNTTIYPSSGWTPPSGQDPFLESYRSTIIHITLKEIKKNNKKHFKKHLKKEELAAITTLRNNKDIVIKPADK